jgi:hypothetical protein
VPKWKSWLKSIIAGLNRVADSITLVSQIASYADQILKLAK